METNDRWWTPGNLRKNIPNMTRIYMMVVAMVLIFIFHYKRKNPSWHAGCIIKKPACEEWVLDMWSVLIFFANVVLGYLNPNGHLTMTCWILMAFIGKFKEGITPENITEMMVDITGYFIGSRLSNIASSI